MIGPFSPLVWRNSASVPVHTASASAIGATEGWTLRQEPSLGSNPNVACVARHRSSTSGSQPPATSSSDSAHTHASPLRSSGGAWSLLHPSGYPDQEATDGVAVAEAASGPLAGASLPSHASRVNAASSNAAERLTHM